MSVPWAKPGGHCSCVTGALSMRTTGHGEVELQPAFLLFLPPRRRGIRSLLIMRHPALHAPDTHVATRRWILQISFGTHCYVAQQQGTSYPSQVPSLEGGVGISARARAHTHTHTHMQMHMQTCARARAHTTHIQTAHTQAKRARGGQMRNSTQDGHSSEPSTARTGQVCACGGPRTCSSGRSSCSGPQCLLE